jgi:hypothetical protein
MNDYINDKREQVARAVGYGFETLNEASDAKEKADLITGEHGWNHEVVDRGENCSPRYALQIIPYVGIPVSYGFNGDYYPCGPIVKVSRTRHKLTTKDGTVFIRQGNGRYKHEKTWSLVYGTYDERNPCF